MVHGNACHYDKSQKDMCHDEVGLWAHYRDTNLELLLHVIGRVYMHVEGERKKKLQN